MLCAHVTRSLSVVKRDSDPIFVAAFPAAGPTPEVFEVLQPSSNSRFRGRNGRAIKSIDFIFIIYWIGKIRLPLPGPEVKNTPTVCRPGLEPDRLQLFVLTRFLDANRVPTSLENALEKQHAVGIVLLRSGLAGRRHRKSREPGKSLVHVSLADHRILRIEVAKYGFDRRHVCWR